MEIKLKSTETVDNVRTGQQVRELREQKGLTLRAVAIKAEMSPTYLSDLELGRRKWSPALLEKIGAALAE